MSICSRVDFAGEILEKAGYDEWEAGQPDHSNNIEHCGTIFARLGYKLNDYPCEFRLQFMCERKISQNKKGLNSPVSPMCYPCASGTYIFKNLNLYIFKSGFILL